MGGFYGAVCLDSLNLISLHWLQRALIWALERSSQLQELSHLFMPPSTTLSNKITIVSIQACKPFLGSVAARMKAKAVLKEVKSHSN